MRQYYAAKIPAGESVTNITMTNGTGPLATGISIDVANEDLVYDGVGPVFIPPVDGSLNVGFDVTTVSGSGSALADWNARSTGPGVIWAHRFTSNSDVAGIWNPNQDTTHIYCDASDGILGDGCMIQSAPAGYAPNGGWNRPLFPITGDINNAGLPVIPLATYGSVYPNMFTNWAGGGQFVNPAYCDVGAGLGHSNEAGKTSNVVYGGGFWIQLRVKFTASRFNSVEATGKWLMFTGNYQNTNQEIVLQAKTSYGGAWYNMYSNQVGLFDDLRAPQWGNRLSIQPGGVPYGPTCLADGRDIGPSGGNCWCYTPDTWITMMFHIVPGHKMPYTGSDWRTNAANIPARDTTIEVFAALPGATSWTTVTSFDQWIFNFAGDYFNNPGGQPFGWNWFNLTFFNGGGSAVPSVNGWSHKFDQIICSLQPIALPAV